MFELAIPILTEQKFHLNQSNTSSKALETIKSFLRQNFFIGLPPDVLGSCSRNFWTNLRLIWFWKRDVEAEAEVVCCQNVNL